MNRVGFKPTLILIERERLVFKMVVSDCICDICKTRPASAKFKVKLDKKRRRQVNSHSYENYDRRIGFWGYIKIDICSVCYDKLFNVVLDVTNNERPQIPPTGGLK